MSAENSRYVYTAKLQVRWGDLDALGHVNNSRYFTYSEQARIDWFEDEGYFNEKFGEQGPVIVATDCTFLKPIETPGELDVKLFLGKLGRSSFVVEHKMYRGEVLYAEGSATIVWVDYKSNKAIRFPDEIRSKIA